jgi:chromosome segregation ATPase
MKLLKKTNLPAGILQELNQQLMQLHELIEKHDEEIKWLEEALVATSGPAQDLIDDLQRNQKRRDEYNFKYSAVMKQIQELRDVS